jgi:hypothetical protein
METLYVANKRILITTGSFYLERGDILSFSAANKNTLTVYRKQNIVKTMPFTLGGLNALVRAAVIDHFQPVEPPAAATEPPPALAPSDPITEERQVEPTTPTLDTMGVQSERRDT